MLHILAGRFASIDCPVVWFKCNNRTISPVICVRNTNCVVIILRVVSLLAVVKNYDKIVLMVQVIVNSFFHFSTKKNPTNN